MAYPINSQIASRHQIPPDKRTGAPRVLVRHQRVPDPALLVGLHPHQRHHTVRYKNDHLFMFKVWIVPVHLGEHWAYLH